LDRTSPLSDPGFPPAFLSHTPASRPSFTLLQSRPLKDQEYRTALFMLSLSYFFFWPPRPARCSLFDPVTPEVVLFKVCPPRRDNSFIAGSRPPRPSLLFFLFLHNFPLFFRYEYFSAKPVRRPLSRGAGPRHHSPDDIHFRMGRFPLLHTLPICFCQYEQRYASPLFLRTLSEGRV